MRYQSCRLLSATSAQHATLSLSMAGHVASVCRSAYYHLRQIRPTLHSLSCDAAKTLVQAFISSRLDYCNSVLYGVTDNLLRGLQSVQNAAARLITQVGHREHISPVLQELHWLPVRCCVDFKLATLMFKSHTAVHRCITQTHASRHLRPVTVSAHLVPSHASYHGPELVWATGCLMSLHRGLEQAACFIAVV